MLFSSVVTQPIVDYFIHIYVCLRVSDKSKRVRYQTDRSTMKGGSLKHGPEASRPALYFHDSTHHRTLKSDPFEK